MNAVTHLCSHKSHRAVTTFLILPCVLPTAALPTISPRAHCWPMFKLLPSRTPALHCKPPNSPISLRRDVAPRLYWGRGLFYPRCRTLYSSQMNFMGLLMYVLLWPLKSSLNLSLAFQCIISCFSSQFLWVHTSPLPFSLRHLCTFASRTAPFVMSFTTRYCWTPNIDPPPFEPGEASTIWKR